ncbi:unnamed protein product [Brassica napus]|uniref:(rape) hypothetical protein n=1 Tax=Brassica napus TaxID=3708 RepID=A0A816ITM2_BRANA|nr:unnamed protein product [Brassica napus]
MSKPRESYELVLRWVVLDSLFFRSKTAFLGTCGKKEDNSALPKVLFRL